jgi:glycine cleavage system H lipoate-binding protein
MVPAIVAITVAVFLVVNFLVNWVVELVRGRRRVRARHRILERSEIAEAPAEAPSLKRVAVDEPLASVLVWSTNPTLLTQFRRALALAGYRVDTVATLPEASLVLGSEPFDLLVVGASGAVPRLDELVQVGRLHDPAPDLIVVHGPNQALEIPGEVTASTTITFPCKDRSLVAQVKAALAERTARLEAERPRVRLVAANRPQSSAKHIINVPAGLFIAPNHTWVSIQPNGDVRIGLDDFALKLLASAVDDVELPLRNDQVGKTVPLFSLYRGTQTIEILSPIDGEVTAVNEALHRDPDLLASAPYTQGWICTLKARNLSQELRELRLGEDAMHWYMDEVDRHLRSRAGLAASADN